MRGRQSCSRADCDCRGARRWGAQTSLVVAGAFERARPDPRKRGHSRERPSSRRVLGHRCRHSADASLRFRMTRALAKGPHPARVVSTRSLVRQLAGSAGHEISPRRRRCAVVFVGRREPTNHALGESRSIFWRRRSLSTKVGETGNRAVYLRASESLHPMLNKG